MKAEARGKYPGLKLHLDEKECQQILEWHAKAGKAAEVVKLPYPKAFVMDVAVHIRKMLCEYPDMLKERTPEQVQAALNKDQKKISQQLAAMDGGKDWKKVK